MSDASSAAPIASRIQRWVVRFVRIAGWVVLILGCLALAGRIVRISIEGIESVEWFQMLFLYPLGFIACGVLWLMSARQLQRAKWLVGIVLIIIGLSAPIASVQLSKRIYDEYLPEDARANSYPWVEFDIPDSPFLVALPHLPERETDVRTTALGDIEIAVFTASDKSIWYLLAISEYSDGTVESITSDGADFSTYMSDAALENRPGSQVLSREPIELSGWVGIEEEVEMPSGRLGKKYPSRQLMAFRRSYQSDNRMAMFMMIIERSTYERDKAEVDRNADRFLNSIRIDPATDERV